jgi:hypothetical protein
MGQTKCRSVQFRAEGAKALLCDLDLSLRPLRKEFGSASKAGGDPETAIARSTTAFPPRKLPVCMRAAVTKFRRDAAKSI